MKKTFMSESGDNVEGSRINSVFYVYRSVKNDIHFEQVDYLDQLKTTTGKRHDKRIKQNLYQLES